jgi:hypothetical protein
VFAFSQHPTTITVTEGIQDAFKYLQTSWRKWLPVVAAIAACSFVLYVLVGSVDTRTLYYTDPVTDRILWYSDAPSKLAGIAFSTVAGAIVSAVGSWVFYALAIVGLRNRPLTAGYVIRRGLLSVVSGLIIAFAVLASLTVLLIVIVIVPPVGLLALVVAIPIGFYLVIRVIFVSLAVFDGFDPIEAIQESWRISNGSVQRMFGWGVLAVLIGLAVGILAGLITDLFATSVLAPLAQAVSSFVITTASVLTLFMMAVLYESERARKDPSLYPVPAFPGYGPNGPEPYIQGPYPARPYAPGPYTAGPYAGGPYPAEPYAPAPADPTAIPGWVAPNGPAPAWRYPPQPYIAGSVPGWPGNPGEIPCPAPAWATDLAAPATLDPAGPGGDSASAGDPRSADVAPQTPDAPQSPEPPAA